MRFADSALRTQAMNLDGVRAGGVSETGVAVPESGRAGDGMCEDSLREEKMPERMAMPRVPDRVVKPIHAFERKGELTTTKDGQGT